MNRLLSVGLLLFLASCSGLKLMNKAKLTDGQHEFRQSGGRYEKVIVYNHNDTIHVAHPETPHQLIELDHKKDKFFRKETLDIDLLSIPFKYRPVSVNLPRQLTSNFNAGLLIGYRIDRFHEKVKETPVGMKKEHHHHAVSVGAFGGVGSANLSPWTTNYQITEEYSALILSRGFSILVGNDTFTGGIGIGWDSITDRDKNVWIYQNKAWYGITIGLNIN